MEAQGSSRLASRWVADAVVDPSWTTPVVVEKWTQQPAILATSENLEKLLEKFVATEAGSSPDVGGSSTARAALSEPVLHRWMKLDGRGRPLAAQEVGFPSRKQIPEGKLRGDETACQGAKRRRRSWR